MQSVVDLGIGHITLETDPQEVVRALNSATYDDSVVGHLVEEIKSLLSSNVISFECVHVGRSCNEAAHELAKLGYLCHDDAEIISSSIPDDIFVIIDDLLANE